MNGRKVWKQAALVALAGACLTGCGNSQGDAVETVAQEFYAALSERDGPAACALVAPTTRSELEQSQGDECRQAVFAEEPPALGEIRDVEVFGTMAEVHGTGDTVFLTRFESGWLVLAAACSRSTGSSYDCQIKGE